MARKKVEVVEEVPQITVKDLLKKIKRECLGCCGQKKDRVYECDCISCAFHDIREMVMDV